MRRFRWPSMAEPSARSGLRALIKCHVRVRLHNAPAGLSGLLAVTLASTACAQVLQIDPDGHVTTFSGPAVFTPKGVTQWVAPALRAPARRSPGASREAFQSAAEGAGLSIDLIAAVAWRESRLRGDVVSARGAVGEMQLMPATARALGVDPADAGQNVRGGAAYLGGLMRRYDGDLVKALAAYDAGPAAVDRYRGVPPFRETQAYVAAVLDRLSQLVVPVAPVTSARR